VAARLKPKNAFQRFEVSRLSRERESKNVHQNPREPDSPSSPVVYDSTFPGWPWSAILDMGGGASTGRPVAREEEYQYRRRCGGVWAHTPAVSRPPGTRSESNLGIPEMENEDQCARVWVPTLTGLVPTARFYISNSRVRTQGVEALRTAGQNTSNGAHKTLTHRGLQSVSTPTRGRVLRTLRHTGTSRRRKRCPIKSITIRHCPERIPSPSGPSGKRACWHGQQNRKI
jgi:hypothetical protein